MQTIFNPIGSVFGYILWALYQVFRNFGVAIIFFTFLTRLILFPSSIKQQKSMAANSRMQAKQRELKEKYGNNRQKYNEEVQKLYEKEGISPTSGCLTSLLPMFVMLGIYYTVVRPLSNVLHLSQSVIDKINLIPGVGISGNNYYSEINALKIFRDPSNVELLVKNGIDQADADKIHNLANSFKFLGIDLLDIPSVEGFLSVIIIIPALVLVTSIGSQILTMRMQSSMMNQQQGCMKYLFLGLPLISVYISYIVPGAVGFYWICSTVIGFCQTLVINKFYSPMSITAKSEAQHVALLELKEAQVPFTPPRPDISENKNNKKTNKKKK